MLSRSGEAISVVGLGKLGVCLAASLSNAGFPVIGADLNESVVQQVNVGEAPFPEPNLEQYLHADGNRIRATVDTYESVMETDISFVVVNTPSTPEGRYDLSAVKAACRDIGSALADKNDYHVVVLTSTVFPGSTTGEVKTTLEEASGKTAGDGFGLCYSPEFIAIGNVIDGIEDPDFFLVGEHRKRVGTIVAKIYERLSNTSTPIMRMPPIDAEITKMTVNAYVTMKISFANTLAEICDGVGGDVDTVTESLTRDSRINGNYLSAGSRFGGPCFPRDNVAFTRLAQDAGTEAPLARSTDKVNDQHTGWIVDTVNRVTSDGGTVAILGMTYKPGTYIVTESQGIELATRLRDDYDIRCYDPMGLEEARKFLGDNASYEKSLESVLKVADTAVVTVPWEELTDANYYTNYTETLVDPWRLFDINELPESTQYIPIGNGRLGPVPRHRRQQSQHGK